MMLLSIVIPTRNEAAHVAACVACFRDAVRAGLAEVIVVDNFSTDGTAALAAAEGARVVQQGPERSAQRNRGALKEASGDFVMFVDADMRVGSGVLGEIVDLLRSPNPPDALYVREEIVGRGLWTRVRNFERSFYDGTCIDALRVIRRSLLAAAGGFDETLYSGEDWDLDRRILSRTRNIAITRGALQHDEGRLTWAKYMRKRWYYAPNFELYCRKWKYDETVRKQFGVRYRVWTVFIEHGKWRRSLMKPHYLVVIWAYKIVAGLIYLVGMRRRAGER